MSSRVSGPSGCTQLRANQNRICAGLLALNGWHCEPDAPVGLSSAAGYRLVLAAGDGEPGAERD